MASPAVFLVLAGVLPDAVGLGKPGFCRTQWVATILGLLLLLAAILLHRKAVRDFRTAHRAYWKTVLFIVVPIGVGVPLAILALDRLLGIYFAMATDTPALIFPPHSTVTYETVEFKYTVQTNSLGIRDREIDVKQGPRFRVIAIGDSFTYGWGVELAESWPKVVERCLRDEGREVEVLNCGRPGITVDEYAEIAKRAIPVLKPDLVLIGVLQGDDLKQLDLMQSHLEDAPGRMVQKTLARVLPSLHRLPDRRHTGTPLTLPAGGIREQWQRQAALIQSQMTPAERERFDGLDPQVKAMFNSGDLHPPWVNAALKYQDYWSFTLEPRRPEVHNAVQTMARHIEAVRQAAGKIDAEIMVLSVPWGPYVSQTMLDSFRRIGFRLPDASLQSGGPDEAIQSACDLAHVKFYSFTDRFRKDCSTRRLFFEFDGHLDAEGQQLYGEEVAAVLLEHLDGANRQRKSLPKQASRHAANSN